MEKEHFEILLEKIESNFQLVFEKFGLVDNGQKAIKTDVRDIKRNMGLLNSIANDHENRLQNMETTLRDHLDDH